MLSNLLHRAIRNGCTLGRRANLDDTPDLIGLVVSGGDYEESGEEVGGDAVGGHNIVRSPDGAHSPVGGEDDDGRYRGFKSAVEICEALHVEHVGLFQLVSGVSLYRETADQPRQ